MDVDSWASRVQATKSLSASSIAARHYYDYKRSLKALERLREEILKKAESIQYEVEAVSSSGSEKHIASQDSEGDDDAKSCFSCPFCYEDIDIPLLCSHLEEEHCFDCKNAVCPLCAANLGKDVIRHFLIQHSTSLKTRRKSQRSGFYTGNSATLGKVLHRNGRTYVQESAPDPLLSPFICNLSFTDPTGLPQDLCSDISSPITPGMKRAEPSSQDEGCEKDKEVRRQRATFTQELIASTIFLDP